MNEHHYLKFTLHPSFLIEPDCQIKQTSPLVDVLRNTFRDLVKLLKIVQLKQDFHKAQHPESYSDLKVEFNSDDENEINRADSYNICQGIEGSITIAKLRRAFESNGIIDSDVQDFILQLILQHRIAIHYTMIEALNTITMTLAKENKHSLISISARDSLDTQALIVEYDKFFKTVRFKYSAKIMYGCGSPIYIGDARITVNISATLDTQIESLYGQIKPFSEIRKLCSDNEQLSDCKEAIQNLYETLKRMRLIPSNSSSLNYENIPSPPMRRSQEQEESLSFWAWSKDKMKNFTQPWLFKFDALFVNSNQEIVREPLYRNGYKSSTLTTRSRLLKEYKEGFSFEKEPKEILKEDSHEVMIENFILHPSGNMVYKKTCMRQESTLNKTYSSTSLKNYEINTIGRYKRSLQSHSLPDFDLSKMESTQIKI